MAKKMSMSKAMGKSGGNTKLGKTKGFSSTVGKKLAGTKNMTGKVC